jgi:DnaJ-like protein
LDDYYSILGVSRSASFADIKKKYLLLVRNYHPDKLPPGTPDLVKKDATEKFLLIQRAYEVLTTSERFSYESRDSASTTRTTQPPYQSPQPEPVKDPRTTSTPGLFCSTCGMRLQNSVCVSCSKPSFLRRCGQKWHALELYVFRNHFATFCWAVFLGGGIPAAIYLPIAGKDGEPWRLSIPEPLVILLIIVVFGLMVKPGIPRIARAVKQLLIQHPVKGGLAVQTVIFGVVMLVTMAAQPSPPVPTPTALATSAPPAATRTPATQATADLSKPVVGAYVGTVTNLTFSKSAEIEMSGLQNGEEIEGCLLVHRPLYGSGPFVGTKHGVNFDFTVTSSMFELKFEGIKSASGLSGTYVVMSAGSAVENGTFEVHKFDNKSPLSPENCAKD